MMKTQFKRMGLIALASALIFPSCLREESPAPAAPEEEGMVSVDFLASFEDDVQTRTSMSVSGGKAEFSWSKYDQLAIRQIHHRATLTEPVIRLEPTAKLTKESLSSISLSASFPVVNLDKILEYPGHKGKKFMYQAFFPASNVQLNPESKGDLVQCVRVTLPAKQTPKQGTFNPKADLLYSAPVYTAEQSTGNKNPLATLKFNRLASIGIMTLKNLPDGSIDSVKVISLSPDVPLAGNIAVRHKTDEFSLENMICTYGSNVLTFDCTKLKREIDKSLKVYFTCLPVKFKKGMAFKVRVQSGIQYYEKTIELTNDDFQFCSGRATVFTVDMNHTEVTPPFDDTLVPDVKRVSMMSYNVFTFDQYANKGVSRNIFGDMAKIIKASNVSFVGLNEVDRKTARHNGVNQPLRLKDSLNCLEGKDAWAYHFSASYAVDGGGYGNAVLFNIENQPEDTSWKAMLNKEKEYVCWRPKKDASGNKVKDKNGNIVYVKKYEEPRCVSVVETKDCVFATVHLGLGETCRKKQVEKLNSVMKERYWNYEKPVILCGDFNADLEAYQITVTDENGTQYVDNHCSVDDLMGTDWLRITKSTKPSHPSGNPDTNKRLDHFFVYQHTAVKKVELDKSGKYGGELVPDYTTEVDPTFVGWGFRNMNRFSDHLPVIVSVKWTPIKKVVVTDKFGGDNAAGKNTAIYDKSLSF